MREYFGNTNLEGQRFGRLTVVSKVDGSRSKWLCRCDCGNTKEVNASQLIKNGIVSCGCRERETWKLFIERTTTHGMTDTVLYGKYCGMKQRCYNPNSEHYNRYGGRGITMCEEWRDSFEAFRDWAYENGYDENKKKWEQTIDRINPDGNYEPSNCRWVDRKTQSRNKENTVWVNVNGNKISAREFAEMNNIDDFVFVFRRVKKGESADKILHDWNMIHHTPDAYMRVNEAAEYYKVCRETIEKWVKRGIMVSEKCGNKLYIPKGQDIVFSGNEV